MLHGRTARPGKVSDNQSSDTALAWTPRPRAQAPHASLRPSQTFAGASNQVQPKLTVNEPGDAFEREADSVADRVMRMASPGAVGASNAPPRVQTLQSAVIGGGQSMSTNERAFFEPRFGRDFGAVRIHTEAKAAESAKSIDALAYTHGRDIVFGHGQYQPGSNSGKRLLAHELAHVMQQEGRSQSSGSPNIQRKCALDTPKDCPTYREWLDTFPDQTGGPNKPGTDITSSMPAGLKTLISTPIRKGGNKPDCADVAVILRHYYLQSTDQNFSFSAGGKRGAAQFSLGKDVEDKEVRSCISEVGSGDFQETREGFALVDFYRSGKGKRKKNTTNLKELIDAGLKAGDIFNWKNTSGRSGFQGHTQTVQAVTPPVIDKATNKETAPGSITFVEGNQNDGIGKGDIESRQFTFYHLTGTHDGNANIKDRQNPKEAFFGAGPWK